MGSEFDVFISYARADDVGGWVSGLRDAVYADFREFSSEPFRIFFDTSAIHSRDDWELRLRAGLRSSRVLLVCLSPNYLRSRYCRWEWEEFARLQARRIGGGDAVTGVYFVELGGDGLYDEEVAAWRRDVERVQFEQLAPWFPDGVAALQDDEVRQRVKALGQGVHDQLRQARLAKQAPGNLRRHNPSFVGRTVELRRLREKLTGGGVGVVTAIHGLGGMGKTELAVTYAHVFAHRYQGGTWQVDADGQTDMWEAVSLLARSPELGLEVREEHLNDPRWLGRLVLARLGELTRSAREDEPENAACLVLLDNVSEPTLLAESQLAVLPEEPWLHLMITTRLGVGDVGSAGVRASVAMIEVGRLDAGDGLELIREHQPARDTAKLHTDFSSIEEEAAAREIVGLLDGYTLAIEQAAVYLGSYDAEPSQLLAELRAEGVAVLDEVGESPLGSAEIMHKDRVTSAVVDQTLARLPQRARTALAYASLLPPDTIPWHWLEHLTEPQSEGAEPDRPRLRGLSVSGDWPSTSRVLEGRRLLRTADDPQLARLHRVLQQHLRARLADPQIEDRLDKYVKQLSQELVDATDAPDPAVLAMAAATLGTRLDEGRRGLAEAGLGLIDLVRQHLDSVSAQHLASATLKTYEQLAAGEPAHTGIKRDLSVCLTFEGDILADRGDTRDALDHYERAVRISEALAAAEPAILKFQRDVANGLDRVGTMLGERADAEGARDRYARALHISEGLITADASDHAHQRLLFASVSRMAVTLASEGDIRSALDHFVRARNISMDLVAAEPNSPLYQRYLALSFDKVGEMLAKQGDTQGALDHYTRAQQILEQLAVANPAHHGYQRDLSFTLNNVGDALLAQGKTRDALALYVRSLNVRDTLATADASHAGRQRDLAAALRRVGNLVKRLGETQAALSYYVRAVTVLEGLAAADPTRNSYQYDLATCLDYVGDLLTASGDVDGALANHTRALHMVETLGADPAGATPKRALSVSHGKVGDLLAAQGNARDALVHHTTALRIIEELAAADPANNRHQRDLWLSAYKLASALESVGDPSAARYWHRAHQVLAALDSSSDLSDGDQAILDFLERKLKRYHR